MPKIKIPVWLLPWKAKKAIAELESKNTALEKSLKCHQDLLNLKIDQCAKNKEQFERQQKNTKGLLRWILVTHRLEVPVDQGTVKELLRK